MTRYLGKCKQCDKLYPPHLLHPQMIVLSVGITKILSCPLCALKTRNKIAELPEDTPFGGKKAHALWLEATQYAKENHTEGGE